jgi:hypothetical protein
VLLSKYSCDPDHSGVEDTRREVSILYKKPLRPPWKIYLFEKKKPKILDGTRRRTSDV